MFNEKDSTTYKKILFPLFFGLGGAMLLYTLSGMITGTPLTTIFLVIFVGTFFYALWNIWQMVDEKFRSKIYGYIALFSVFFMARPLLSIPTFRELSLQFMVLL